MDQDIYKIKIKVTSQKGKCEAGHKVGDEFEAAGLTPPGMCIFAFSSILPSLTPLMFGGQFWERINMLLNASVLMERIPYNLS